MRYNQRQLKIEASRFSINARQKAVYLQPVQLAHLLLCNNRAAMPAVFRADALSG